jgi:predicted AAA+ superfamily ATPase
MIPRHDHRQALEARLAESPAVALLGPRQVGKTTLALEVAQGASSVYLDLESPSDRNKLTDPELYLRQHLGKLVILDEIHLVPDLFPVLRGLIDEARRGGEAQGRYLILGSASPDLLRQSSESLAGRISYLELPPFSVRDVDEVDRLWLRGGFPESFLARSGASSARWRRDFIRTYLERDIPQLGPRIPAETLRRFWTMLAHHQGGLHNAASLARGLAVDGKTIASYLDLFVDLLLVRRLPAWHQNTGKRLTRSPKVYVRDSGLLHELLGITDHESLLGHPVVGASWEGFLIENILNTAPEPMRACFYRTAAGAEIDLVLEPQGGGPIAIEIKRSLSPKVPRGFRSGCADIGAKQAFILYPGDERYPLGDSVEAIGLMELLEILSDRDWRRERDSNPR